RRYHAEGHHDSIRVFFAYFGDEQSTHAGTGATAQRVSELESLEAVAALGLLANDVQDGVDELGALGVVPLRPVVTRAALPEHEVVRSEYLTERPRTNRVHRPGLQIDQDRTRHVFTACRLVVVNIYPLQLQIRVTVIRASGIDSMLVRDHLPELRSL
ncbi:hypothetical protein ALC56_04982, partial [Trachymyrmex septentrionalis]